MPVGRGGGRGGGGYRTGVRAGGKGGTGQGGPRDEEYAVDEDDFDPEMNDAEEFDDSSDPDAANDELVQSVALPVSGAPLPPSDEPAKDADEYLRRVQWERMHLAETVEVEVEEKPRRKRPTNNRTSLLTRFEAPEIPEVLQHCAEWAEDVIAAFRDLRAQCDDLRQPGTDEVDAESVSMNVFSADVWHKRLLQDRPTTSLLGAQDVVSVHKLLNLIIDAISEAHDATTAAPTTDDGAGSAAAADEASAAAAGPFAPSSFLAEWAFAVLAFVEEPLVDDIQFNLQRLRRTCQNVIVAAHSRSEAGSCEFDSNAHAQATLLLTVVRDHFGQR